MILAIHCEKCGAATILHKGDIVELPPSLKLIELIAVAHDDHVCRQKENHG